MIVVSDTSPIINLAAVGQLQLLEQLYGRIIVPQAVYREIVILGDGQPGAVQVKSADWFEVRPVSNQTLVASLQLRVDEGEAQAIALAADLNADLLLLDEKRGRVAAAHLGLRFIGLVGILVEAKHNGLVAAVKPVLDDMMEKAGFWIGPELYDRVLQSAGE